MSSVQTRNSVFSIDNSLVNGHFIFHLQCLILQLKCKVNLSCFCFLWILNDLALILKSSLKSTSSETCELVMVNTSQSLVIFELTGRYGISLISWILKVLSNHWCHNHCCLQLSRALLTLWQFHFLLFLLLDFCVNERYRVIYHNYGTNWVPMGHPLSPPFLHFAIL